MANPNVLNISVVGSGTSSKLGNYNSSAVINGVFNFTATPANGNKIQSVTLDGVNIPDTINASGAQTFDIAIGAPKPAFALYYIVVTFAVIEVSPYILNITSVGNGSLSKLGYYRSSDVVNGLFGFTATPANGNKIQSVTLDGVNILDTINLTGSQSFNIGIGAVKPNDGLYYIIVTFAAIDTPFNTENLTVPCGNSFTRTFERADKLLHKIIIDGVETILNVPTHTVSFTNIQSPKQIKAFWKPYYLVTVLTSLNNIGANPQSANVLKGEDFSTVITPPNLYEIESIKINEVNFTGFTASGYTLNLTDIEEITIIEVVFVEVVAPNVQTLQVNWTSGLSVSATVNGVAISLTNGLIHNIAENVPIVLTLQLTSGYAFDRVERNNVLASLTTPFSGGIATYEFNSSTINQFVNFVATVVSVPTLYNVYVYSQGQGQGTFTPNYASLAGGSNFSSVISPAAGSFVHSAWVSGTSNFLSVPYVGGTINITTKTNENTVVFVRFDKYTYNVAVFMGVNGTASSAGAIVDWGSNFSVSILPNSGYEIDTITINGVSQPVSNRELTTVSLTNIQADQNVQATFRVKAAQMLRIYVSFGTIGNPNNSMASLVSSVSPQPPFIEVSPNTAQTLSSTTLAGYQFGTVTLNGSQIHSGGTSFSYNISSGQMTIDYYLVIQVLPVQQPA